MRKIGVVWIVLGLMLAAFLLAGCQKKTSVGENGGAAAGDPAASALTEAEDWQTQYDLGLRYLSEGKYEEAIIAFTAAIQIEPRRAAGYTALADAYTKNGQTDEARRVLTEAPEDVDDPDAIQAALDGLGEDGQEFVEFTERKNYVDYEDMAPEEQGILDRLIEAAIAGDDGTLQGGIMEYQGILNTQDGTGTVIYTMRDGWKVRLEITRGVVEVITDSLIVDELRMEIEVRTENGPGYCCEISFDMETGGTQVRGMKYIKGSCKNWQWDGGMTETYSYHDQENVDGWIGTYNDERETSGSFYQNLRTGTFTTERRIWGTKLSDEGVRCTEIRTYEAGRKIGETARTCSVGEWDEYEADDLVFGIQNIYGDWETAVNELHW